jgi:hypothetical protein
MPIVAKYAAKAEIYRTAAKEKMASLRATPEGRAVLAARERKYIANLRVRVLTILGNQCRCGQTNSAMLQVDHRHDDGAAERKSLSCRQLYLKILANPEGYQLLCANCNWRKRNDKASRSEEVESLRLAAIAKCGGCCTGCGEADEAVLQFDHVENDGWMRHRNRQMRLRYKGHIRDATGIQLLCANCHQVKIFAKEV